MAIWLPFASSYAGPPGLTIAVLIAVPRGEELARHTLNPRLGIVGGISILGTTGIVKPFSNEAYQETIDSALQVAVANTRRFVVLSTGGKSERLAQSVLENWPEEAFVQIGDFFAYAVKGAVTRGFKGIVHSVFFGKAIKMAQGQEYTHAHRSPTATPTKTPSPVVLATYTPFPPYEYVPQTGPLTQSNCAAIKLMYSAFGTSAEPISDFQIEYGEIGVRGSVFLTPLVTEFKDRYTQLLIPSSDKSGSQKAHNWFAHLIIGGQKVSKSILFTTDPMFADNPSKCNDIDPESDEFSTETMQNAWHPSFESGETSTEFETASDDIQSSEPPWEPDQIAPERLPKVATAAAHRGGGYRRRRVKCHLLH